MHSTQGNLIDFKSDDLKAGKITYRHLEKATKRVLADLVRYYFPLYGLGAEQLLEDGPLLGFVEALIYQADESVEATIAAGRPLDPQTHWTPQLEHIQNLLRDRHLLTSRLQKYLDDIGTLFHLESQLLSTPPRLTEGWIATDIVRAAEIRSADYRVLHCLLIQMEKIDYVPGIFNLMEVYEILVDLMEDLKQYEQDITANTYNTYRVLTKYYGVNALQKFQILLDQYRQKFAVELKQFPAEQQQQYLTLLNMNPESLEFPDYGSEIPAPILEF